ncbi:amino acid permease [Allorhodopirellula solitaria]|uniref:Putative amino acid permease YhdG n=1 Tax=Allorhodopirellula solitaria TaxID=2527987 RepID=A0A5C5YGC1_9BACT|nr:amino acid permease [Allorhodopirellula solitaria]TWT73943.1 putative amino acid permease YhdG [Allorhodopirellula solitaria]
MLDTTLANHPMSSDDSLDSDQPVTRHLGLIGATGVGVGGIVGGGILALAGVAFATTGPGAIVAFALNGVIAILTAMSFAEMSSKFPESGGTYLFSRKVLSVEAAFTVGWVVWFASIVAAVLYAIGFGSFAVLMTEEILELYGGAPAWLGDERLVPATALVTTLLLGLIMMLRSGGGGPWINITKVAVFCIVIVGGLWAVGGQPAAETQRALHPFLIAGVGGLIQAMGYSFIAMQGFDLIAAVGGEVRNPAKNIPRAMILSLVIALLIYMPLLFVIVVVGTPSGTTIAQLAAEDPEAVVAVAAEQFLGPTGYWLVIIAAVLSMFTALQANLFAASRIALAMSRDHTLPSWMSRVGTHSQTPWVAVLVTMLLIGGLIIALPDVAAAGAASSLIFLVTFAIAHGLAMLVRRRSLSRPPFQSPAYPLVPIVGGLACLALATFQGIAVPAAGYITVTWLTVGGVLFLTLFARRARLTDVSNLAANPELARLRGRTPLMLVPIANPHNAGPMVALAETLVPWNVGRVLVQTVVEAPVDWDPVADPRPLQRLSHVQSRILQASVRLGIRCETLTTVSAKPLEEISRVAQLHRCESVLLGLNEITLDSTGSPLEKLLGELSCDVVVLRAPKDWELAHAERILVPVGGDGGHDYLLTRLLSSLSRDQKRQVQFLRVVSPYMPEQDRERVARDLQRTADENFNRGGDVEVIEHGDPVGTIVDQAGENGLIVLGVQRIGPREKLFGDFTRQIAQRTQCPIIIISRRG